MHRKARDGRDSARGSVGQRSGAGERIKADARSSSSKGGKAGAGVSVLGGREVTMNRFERYGGPSWRLARWRDEDPFV